MKELVLKAALLVIASIIAFAIFFGWRSYLYLVLQYTTAKIGLNLNNIATGSYVEWIKTQPNRIEDTKEAIFLNRQIRLSANLLQREVILGETTADDNKWIEVDLSEQRLYLKENGNTINSFLVSTGKWSPTPKGEWRIWIKLTSTRMVGGSKALGTYYNLPNVPYTMYYDRGYGIHGAYWHNNFGNPMSHGCTNMKPEEAKIVFEWASVGTKVKVQD